MNKDVDTAKCHNYNRDGYGEIGNWVEFLHPEVHH